MSATIPALKSFMKDFTTGGVGYSEDLTGAGNKSGSSNSYNMLSLSKSKTEAGLLPDDYPTSAAHISSNRKLGPASSREPNKAIAGGENQESESIASVGSKRILIRKGWEITTID